VEATVEEAEWILNWLAFILAWAVIIAFIYVALRALFSGGEPKDQEPAEPRFTPKSQVNANNEASKANRKPVTNGNVKSSIFSDGMTLDDENAPCFIHGVPKRMCKEKH
jgi:hypothetical protein